MCWIHYVNAYSGKPTLVYFWAHCDIRAVRADTKLVEENVELGHIIATRAGVNRLKKMESRKCV